MTRGGIPIWAHEHRYAVALAVVAVVAMMSVVGFMPSEGPSRLETRADPSEPAGPAGRADRAWRAFHADSWWNTPLPDEVPLDPAGEQILEYLRTAPESGRGCVTLAGAGDSPWGQPVYDARPTDPAYDVEGLPEPLPELTRLRIPVGARSALNSDRSMIVYDRSRGYVVALTGADYDARRDAWSAAGATVTYLDSNGLHARTGQSDDPRNRGTHRGNNGAVMAVEHDEVVAGAIRHVLKVAAGPEVADRHVFPMIGSDGDYQGSDPAVPPQGLRFRIKPTIDLEAMGLGGEALVIARALQDYGFYIGDSGGTTALKLEDTRAQGEGQLWSVAADDLCALPLTLDYWDVVAEGYDPTREGGRG
jgi:hypothetical protein